MSDNPTPEKSTRPLWFAVVVVLGGITVLFALQRMQAPPGEALAQPAALEVSLPLPPFTFTERDGTTVTRDSLKGSTWIADFVFTRCAGPCPMMTRHMQRLQTDLADVTGLKLVSFSVDPERDTPEVLTAYARQYDAHPERWLFLTGEVDAMYDIAIKGFRITVEEARENQQIIHDTRFMLVDDSGNIRGYYDSAEPEALDRLRDDARTLAQ